MYVQTWFFHKGMNFSKHVTVSGEHQMHSSVLSMTGNTSNVISILRQTSVLNDEIVMVSQGIK